MVYLSQPNNTLYTRKLHSLKTFKSSKNLLEFGNLTLIQQNLAIYFHINCMYCITVTVLALIEMFSPKLKLIHYL